MTNRPTVDDVLRTPPVVHGLWDETGTRVGTGLWPTDKECYQFIAEQCGVGSRTLETGLGLSTAVLAVIGSKHTCVTYSSDEVERLREYCTDQGIPLDTVTFAVGLSDDVLPTLDPTPLDLVLIDGGHGFPTPIIDWFYGAGRLVEGGVVVIDDVNLPAPAQLVDFLRQDPRWSELRTTAKWVAFRRDSAGDVSEDWWAQKWFTFQPEPSFRQLLKAGITAARRRLPLGARHQTR